MTQAQEHYQKKLIKSLHISRRYREYFKDEKEEYRELLQEHYGVDTSKKLTINQLITLVDYMNFKDVKLPTYKRRGDEFGARATKPQLEMMKGLWNSFADNPTDTALLAFVNRQTKKTYLYVYMVSKTEAQKIIPVLQRMKEK